MADRLGFPFEVGGPSSGSVTDFRKVRFRNYREDPASSGLLAASSRDLRKGLPHKPGRSSAIRMRLLEVFKGCQDCG
jgi:hypothetical protein